MKNRFIPVLYIIIFGLYAAIAACSKSGNTGGGPTPPPPPPPPAPITFEKVFTDAISGTEEANRLQVIQRPTDFLPAGIYVLPNNTLKITVQQVSGTSLPKLLIGTYSRLAAKNNPQEFQLTAGVNNLTADAYGGLVFIRYVSSAPSGSQAKIIFESGFVKAPYYVAGTTTEANWDAMLSSYSQSPDVVLEGQRSIMVMARATALGFQTQDQGAILAKADQILDIEDDISGLDGSAPQHQKIRGKTLMTETDNVNYYMFATYYRTAYVQNTATPFAFSNKLGSLEGWGPWHELGHMHQQTWTWGAVMEATVNIYSLVVEKNLGHTPNRLVRENKWAVIDPYFALPTPDFNSSQLDVWGRLLMFRQLTLAFGDDFYRNLHKITRIEKPTLADDQAKMRYFMLKACTVSSKNLTNFFKKWGLPVPQSVYDEIAALNLALPLIDPSTLRE